MTSEPMVIIGAGMAGARAVIALRAAGWTGGITLIGDESLPPYDRPPLSKAAIASTGDPQPVLLLDDGMIASLKADFIRGNAATAIDRQARAVTLADGRIIPYVKLLIATGARPRPLPVPGGDRALTLRDFPDVAVLRRSFTEGRRIAIIGGGFIGLELASSAAKRGCAVTLIEALPRILSRGVPPEIAEVVHQRHIKAGVIIHTGTAIASLSAEGVHLQDGRTVAADTIIAGIGAVPETRLAAAAGLVLDNGIACDGAMRTSDPDIYAAGDCCSFPHPLFGGKRMRLEAWRNATDQANVACENMVGGNKTYTAVPWFWSDQYELNLQIAGVPGEGTSTVRRQLGPESFVIFHRDANGRLTGASGIGPGNTIARDVRMAEMLIGKQAAPAVELLQDPAVALKSLLKP